MWDQVSSGGTHDPDTRRKQSHPGPQVLINADRYETLRDRLQSREGEAVRAEFLFEIFQAHEFRESRASAIHAALDRSDGAPADLSGLFVGEARGADQK